MNGMDPGGKPGALTARTSSGPNIVSAPRPCLIGGSGRSGTTILKRVFSRHPDVAILPTEARFLVDPDGIVDFHVSLTGAWSPYAFDLKLRRLLSLLRALGPNPVISALAARQAAGKMSPAGRAVARDPLRSMRSSALGSAFVRALPRYWTVNLEASCPGYRGLVEELGDRLVDFRYKGRWMGMQATEQSMIAVGAHNLSEPLEWFCRSVVGRVCAEQGATHLVEDTPFNLLAFDGVLRLLPDARLVHIYRDPRDVVASYLGKRWSPSQPLQAARFYAALMRRWDVIREKLPAASYLEIGLESLVRDREPTLRSVADTWGLTWHSEVLNVDLSQAHTGRWQSEIPQDQVSEMERILGPYVERYGQ